MSKRFTDTEKFNDPWYRRLTLLQKVIWEYLLAECNHAGIFEKFDIELMSFKIGESIALEDLEFLKDKIVFINDETLFICKFITFQYGVLNPKNKVHASVLKELEKWKIQDTSKDLASPLLGSKDKNKENINKKKEKKIDPYFNNPIADYFKSEYKRISKKDDCYLDNSKLNKLLEISADYPTFKERLPEILEKFFKITFPSGNKPSTKWLIIDGNWAGILNGEYDQYLTDTTQENEKEIDGWTL